MGLDTTSYAKIAALPEDWEPTVEGNDPEDLFDYLFESGIHRACTYPDFPRAMDGLDGGHDLDSTLDFPALGNRWYHMEGRGPTTGSSYSGHSMFRTWIILEFWSAELYSSAYDNGSGFLTPAKYVDDAPFIDLLYFADNEGILGPEACYRLNRDFSQRVPGDSWDENEYYQRLYREWKDAVAHASNGGCIRFH